jgi:hypothetical protein
MRIFTIITLIVCWLFSFSSLAKDVQTEIFSLNSGDFVSPRLSPSGQFLAVAQVFGDASTEWTQILLINLKTRHIDTLIDSSQAAKHAVYKSFISDLKWRSDDSTIIADIHNGDDGITRLIVSIHKRILAQENPGSAEEATIDTRIDSIKSKILLLYPELSQQPLKLALEQRALLLDNGILIQKNYFGEDNNVWLLGVNEHKITKLVAIDDNSPYSFGGGFSIGNSGLFCVNLQSTACLYKTDNNKAVRLFSTPCKLQTPYLTVRYQTKNEAWFMLVVNEQYEKGNNSIFYFDGQLFPILKTKDLYDFDIGAQCTLAAFAFWENNTRHITVRRIK